jgi:hypothetical protein
VEALLALPPSPFSVAFARPSVTAPPHALAATLTVMTNGIFIPSILDRFLAMPRA